MSRSIHLAFILFIAISFFSCEDIIEIETAPAPDFVVVDAWLDNRAVDQTIRLTQSQSFFDNSLPTGLLGATVEVVSSNNDIFQFTDIGDGLYVWTSQGDSLGVPGMTYTLNIEVDGLELTSSVQSGRVPQIDSIQQEFREESIMGPEGIYTTFIARDPVGRGDTYWIRTFKNGHFLDKPQEINIAFDAGFDAGAANLDGLVFIQPIRELTNPVGGQDDSLTPPWSTGDEIRIEIHSISNGAFFFLETARDQVNNGDNGLFSIPIANSPGNIINQTNDEEILGVFNVASVSSLTNVIN